MVRFGTKRALERDYLISNLERFGFETEQSSVLYHYDISKKDSGRGLGSVRSSNGKHQGNISYNPKDIDQVSEALELKYFFELNSIKYSQNPVDKKLKEELRKNFEGHPNLEEILGKL